VAYVNLGTSLVANGRLADAASALLAGSRANGERVRDRREHEAARVSALVQLAALYSQQRYWNKALLAYKEALQILPDSDAPVVGWTRHVSFIYIYKLQLSLARCNIDNKEF
jgi:protein O-mannosyl-transferase